MNTISGPTNDTQLVCNSTHEYCYETGYTEIKGLRTRIETEYRFKGCTDKYHCDLDHCAQVRNGTWEDVEITNCFVSCFYTKPSFHFTTCGVKLYNHAPIVDCLKNNIRVTFLRRSNGCQVYSYKLLFFVFIFISLTWPGEDTNTSHSDQRLPQDNYTQTMNT